MKTSTILCLILGICFVLIIGIFQAQQVQPSSPHPPFIITKEDVGKIYDTPNPHVNVDSIPFIFAVVPQSFYLSHNSIRNTGVTFTIPNDFILRPSFKAGTTAQMPEIPLIWQQKFGPTTPLMILWAPEDMFHVSSVPEGMEISCSARDLLFLPNISAANSLISEGKKTNYTMSREAFLESVPSKNEVTRDNSTVGG